MLCSWQLHAKDNPTLHLVEGAKGFAQHSPGGHNIENCRENGDRCKLNTRHNQEDVPDEESGASGSSARSGKGRVLEFGILVDPRGDPFPCFHVTVQFPLLFVYERLNVDAGNLTAVLFQFHFDV